MRSVVPLSPGYQRYLTLVLENRHQQTFSKGPDSEYFRLCEHVVSVATTQPGHGHVRIAQTTRKEMSLTASQ